MFLSDLFLPKSFNEGYLPSIDGHRVYFYEFGNPKGIPVLYTHGGPGSGIKIYKNMLFDLKKYRHILMDQRGCGKSLPSGELKKNTTQDLVSDMHRLLDFLNVKGKVAVRGGSWGSTMALLFAEAYPDKVSKLIVTQIFLADEMYKKWFLEDSTLFYPDVMEKVKASNTSKKTLPQDCLDKLLSNNLKKQLDAASNYGAYENNLGALEPTTKVLEIEERKLSSMKIFMHYDGNDYFLKKDEILKNIGKIKHIPTLIVHNRLDFCCPLKAAYELHKQLPKSKLVIVPDMGHGSDRLYKVMKKESREFLNDK